MSCMRLCVVVFALLGLMVGSSNALAAISVDGDLSDWGITLSGGKHLLYNSAYGYSYSENHNVQKRGQATIFDQNVTYHLEDSNDHSNSYQVGPLYGGQNYDAEVLAASVVGQDLYIAISTGQRPDNTAKRFAPGDICITQGTKVWGIEVGGGTHTALSAIVEGDPGASFQLYSRGDTKSSTIPAGQTAGSVWEGGSWSLGIDGSGGVRTQLDAGGVFLGLCDFEYLFSSSLGEHAFIELCIPQIRTLLGCNPGDLNIRWAPVCGNDQLDICVTLPPAAPPPGSLPEPASIAVWAVLLLVAVGFARWKRTASEA
jgi:hypothetical protein